MALRDSIEGDVEVEANLPPWGFLLTTFGLAREREQTPKLFILFVL
jgi:hypothetical protein